MNARRRNKSNGLKKRKRITFIIHSEITHKPMESERKWISSQSEWKVKFAARLLVLLSNQSSFVTISRSCSNKFTFSFFLWFNRFHNLREWTHVQVDLRLNLQLLPITSSVTGFFFLLLPEERTLDMQNKKISCFNAKLFWELHKLEMNIERSNWYSINELGWQSGFNIKF